MKDQREGSWLAPHGLSRRALLSGGVAALAGPTAANALGADPAMRSLVPRAVPLPSPQEVRRDFQTMVDFGPRLTGNRSHLRFINWLQREFVDAGALLMDCDEYDYERWACQDFGLEILDGASRGKVRVATPYTRSQETTVEGVTGPLVYGGVVPMPALNGTDATALTAALEAYPAQIASWASGLAGTVSGVSNVEGSIVLLDLPVPLPITAGAFTPIATYLHWPDHTIADWARVNYDRSWILPGIGLPLAPFQELGAAGVVFVMNRSFEALQGNYLPFVGGYEPVPALFVDRDTGRDLRAAASTRPQTTLTLTATRTPAKVSSVTAIVPGESDEVVILNTHTDGQGFVEENGAVAFVQLARHFASLPPGERLKRTLVFACWPGHMAGGGSMPELEGWMAAHKDLVGRAAAALTIEHLGCTEWLDDLDKGYHATGENELFGVWTTQGPLFDITKDATIKHNLVRTALLRPPVQFGVGGAFQSAGVPQIGAIAGPEYLLTVTPNGDMDKLDERLAADQIAWVADIVKATDKVSFDELRAGDPTLGNTVPEEDPSTPVTCGPADRFVIDAGQGRALAIRLTGLGGNQREALIDVAATGAKVDGVSLELRRADRVVARTVGAARVSRSTRRLKLRSTSGGLIARGSYELLVRIDGKTAMRRAVHLGSSSGRSA